MNTFLRVCTMACFLSLTACGGSAESSADAAPSAQVDVPIHPLPLIERN